MRQGFASFGKETPTDGIDPVSAIAEV